MAVFLGVSRTLSFLNKKPGDLNFWCIGGTSKAAKPGDQLLLYFPQSASSTKNGIGQIYQITSTAQKSDHSACHSFGMSEVETQLLLNLNTHIQIRYMKADPVLRKWGAVGRNMQGVTFAVNSEIWPSLRAMIVASNPNADAVLETVK